MPKKALDVLVVGAGPVGIFCANELVRQGLSCRIIDKKTSLSDKSKALALHIRTLDLLDDCGLIDDFLAQGHKINGVLLKSNGRQLVHMTFAEVKANRHFVIDLPQDKTELILDTALRAKKVEVEWQTELTAITQNESTVCATLAGADGKIETVTASWLIACDGGHSTVREQLKVEFFGSEYNEKWWLADLLIDWDLPEDKMVICPSEDGPLACFPMGNKRYRLVMTAPEGSETDPSMEDVVAVFNHRSSDKAVLSNPIWITKFYLHHRQAQQYRKDRVFFAGDAAHIHSPMGGQGLNTGIQDVYNLIWKLALVNANLAKETLLDSYHAERYPVGHSVLKKTDVMTKVFIIKNPLLIRIRNFIISRVMSIKFIKDKFAESMAELDISYAKSPIVASLGSVSHFKAGHFLVDFNLSSAKTKGVTALHEIIRGKAHHLLLFAGLHSPDVAKLVDLVKCISDKYPKIIIPHLILCHEIANLDCPATTWLDDQQHLHHQYAIEQPTALLLRPDKYIGLTQSPVNKDELMSYLASIFN